MGRTIILTGDISHTRIVIGGADSPVPDTLINDGDGNLVNDGDGHLVGTGE